MKQASSMLGTNKAFTEFESFLISMMKLVQVPSMLATKKHVTLAIHASYRGDSSYKHTRSIVDFQALPTSGVRIGEDGSVPSCFTGNM